MPNDLAVSFEMRYELMECGIFGSLLSPFG